MTIKEQRTTDSVVKMKTIMESIGTAVTESSDECPCNDGGTCECKESCEACECSSEDSSEE